MSILHWELSVLSRSVAYKNLSSASDNVGVSQPQLSRIVARLEENVGVALLDRSSRRNSGWTPAAFRLAELYSGSTSTLERQLRALSGQSLPKQLKIGTLEGLANIATEMSREIFDELPIEQIELNVHDLHELEELFFKGSLDLAFVSRFPGRKKPRYFKHLGNQSIEVKGSAGGIAVISPFEQQTRRDASGREVALSKPGAQVLVSNSLAIRKRWIEELGGTGMIPSAIRSSGKGTPAYLVASEAIGPGLWEKLS